MILGDRKKDAHPDGETTLDDIFERAVARRPDAIALADPPNRVDFTDGAPRRITYGEADRIIGAIAARLTQLGLQPDTVVGLSLPNTVEAVLTILGVLRAKMIAAPLPLLWRRAEAKEALGRIGAKIIITASRVGGFDQCGLAMAVAAELFPVRYVCGFGTGLPDGVVSFDELLTPEAAEAPPARDRDRALHVALVTWDVTPDGPVAVARNHTELIAGGLATLLEGGLEQDAVILGGCATSSFAGLALTVMPWLLCGGTLCLHHGFDAAAFAAQSREERCDTVVAPGALVSRLAAAGLLADPALQNVLALWRAPERLLTSPAWLRPRPALIDMLAFGEAAVLGARRGGSGLPAFLPPGNVSAPQGSAQAVWVAEIARTVAGTLALRGPMVPRHAFPPGADRLVAPYWRANAAGFVDTGYSCRHDRTTETVQVTAPPPGIVSVGGYRFVLRELEDQVRQAWSGAAIAALPDTLAGHRLAGLGGDADSVRAQLLALGANALVTEAFRDRRREAA